jgi:hypothetical protein
LKRLEIVPFGLLCTDPVLAWENIRACVWSSEESIPDKFRSKWLLWTKHNIRLSILLKE